MKRGMQLIVGAAALAWCVFPGSSSAAGFMHGDSRRSVVQRLGEPLRRIDTGQGELLFYGSVFLEVIDSAVVFVNVSSPELLEARRLRDARQGVFWGAIRPDPPPPEIAEDVPGRRAMTAAEQEEYLAARRRHRERVIETRVRRFLLTHTFRKILESRTPLRLALHHDEDMDRHLSEDPDAHEAWRRTEAQLARESVSYLALRDSRARRIPEIGEEFSFVERHIRVESSLLDPVGLP